MKIFDINSGLLESLGWTILHSVWIIALIAALLFLILRFRKHTSSHFRYNVSLFSISLSALLVVSAFFWELKIETEEQVLPHSETGIYNFASSEPITLEREIHTENGLLDLAVWLKSNTALFAQIWLMGVLLMCIRFSGGYLYLSRLRSNTTEPLDVIWVNKLKILSKRIGLNESPEIKSSRLISSPITLGFFRPLILLPIGMIEGLSTKELESILVHELYHIKRHDFLVNIFQSLIEVVLFYHPAIWWMSSIVRQEREYCCDDQTVLFTGNALEYAKALTIIQDFGNGTKPSLSMAAIGQKRSLSTRIYRLFQINEKTSGLKGIASLIVLAIAFSGFSILVPIEEQTSISPNQIQIQNQDTVQANNYIKWTADMVEAISLNNGNKKLRLDKPYTFEVSQSAFERGPILFIDGRKIESKDQLEGFDPTKIQFITTINDERELEKYGQKEMERGIVLVETSIPLKKASAEWPQFKVDLDSSNLIKFGFTQDGGTEMKGNEKALKRHFQEAIRNSYKQRIDNLFVDKEKLAHLPSEYKVMKCMVDMDSIKGVFIYQFSLKQLVNSGNNDVLINAQLFVRVSDDKSKDTTKVKERVPIKVSNNKEPLFVIDGEVLTRSDLDKINPNEINKISIIKGARAIEIYGQDGKNGVVLIESKASRREIKKIDSLTNWIERAAVLEDSVNNAWASFYSSKSDSYIQSVKLYPNPASNYFKIDFEVLKEESDFSFTIFDSNGNKVLSLKPVKYPKGKHTFVYENSYSSLKKGVYIVDVRIDEQKHPKRLFIE